jgi:DNA invertase Pin-like site-specific DNA recombinase
MKKRVAFYVRVSTKDQTVEHQLPVLKKWAKNAGHKVVETYSDKISGAKKSRPGFNRLMKAARMREFDIVAVWSLDRLGRSVSHVTSIIDELRELGIDVFLAKDSLDTTTSSGRIVMQVLSMVAEMERELLRERTVAGLNTARRRGVKLGRPRESKTEAGKRLDADIRAALKSGQSTREIKGRLGVGGKRIQRVRETLSVELESKAK